MTIRRRSSFAAAPMVVAWLVGLSASSACLVPSAPTIESSNPHCKGDRWLSSMLGEGACRDCLAEGLPNGIPSACSELVACADDASCNGVATCVAACHASPKIPDPVCLAACQPSLTTPAKLGSLYEKVASSCRDACDFTTDFRCVGKYAWPTAIGASARLTLHFVDATTNAPLDGITVAPCAFGGACDTSETRTLGADGLYDGAVSLLTIQGSSARWSGYFDVGGPDHYPIVFHESRPTWTDRETRIPLPSKKDIDQGISAAFGGATMDAASGVVVGAIQDCRAIADHFAGGLVVRVKGQNVPVVYLDTGPGNVVPLPTSATATVPGTGAFIVRGVPPGVQTIEVVEPSGATFASVDTQIVAGGVTVIGIWPEAS